MIDEKFPPKSGEPLIQVHEKLYIKIVQHPKHPAFIKPINLVLFIALQIKEYTNCFELVALLFTRVFLGKNKLCFLC